MSTTTDALFDSIAIAAPLQAPPRPTGGRPEDVLWLIKMRWLAIPGIVVAVLFSLVTGIVEVPWPLFTVAGALGAFNIVWHLKTERAIRAGRRFDVHRTVLVQLFVDSLVLSVLLYLGAGIENPFVLFFVFQAALGGILLPQRQAWLFVIGASLLHSTLILGDELLLIPHCPFQARELLSIHTHVEGIGHHNRLYLLGYLLAFWGAMLGTVFFIRRVRERQEEAERLRQEGEEVARARTRLARVGELSAGIAHSIRNPLHGALNCVDLLESSTGGRRKGKFTYDMLREALERINRVIDRLLQLTRDRPIVRRPTPIADLFHDAAQFIGPRLRKKSLCLKVEVDSETVVVDAALIVEVLASILDNAIDASPVGGTVKLRAEGAKSVPDMVVIEVEDEGPGIPEPILPQVFHPFFTTKPVGEGTGLGLAVARRVVSAHKGLISLHAGENGGTVVRILLERTAKAQGRS